MDATIRTTVKNLEEISLGTFPPPRERPYILKDIVKRRLIEVSPAAQGWQEQSRTEEGNTSGNNSTLKRLGLLYYPSFLEKI